jgi:hypothetical protein
MWGYNKKTIMQVDDTILPGGLLGNLYLVNIEKLSR